MLYRYFFLGRFPAARLLEQHLLYLTWYTLTNYWLNCGDCLHARAALEFLWHLVEVSWFDVGTEKHRTWLAVVLLRARSVDLRQNNNIR